MTIHEFKLGGGNERSNDAAQMWGDAQPSTSYPSPLPDVDASMPEREPPAAAAADASTAPTIRPPASAPPEATAAPSLPAAAAPAAAAPASTSPAHAIASAFERSDSLGFTSVIRHLSLRGWLRWIHSNRSDATLRVRTRDAGNGRIWCNAGKIIDAEWDGLGPEEAVREMLALSSGAVTIDFDRIDHHPRRIARPMHELLHLPEGSHGRFTDTAHAAALAASAAGSVRGEFRNTLFLPSSSAPASALGSLRRSRPDPRPISRGEYLAGVFLLAALAVAAFSFGRMRAASQVVELAEAQALQTEQTRAGLFPPRSALQAASEAEATSPKPLDLPLIPFVAIEVDPPRAEIWLDQELIGLGRIQLAAIRDGMLHELRFMAPGHETKSVFFRDTPPAGRVTLGRVADAPVIAGTSTEATSEAANETPTAEGATTSAKTVREEERESAKRVPRRRAPWPPPRERFAAEPAPQPAAKSVQSKKSPRIQLIEVQTPRVQVLD